MQDGLEMDSNFTEKSPYADEVFTICTAFHVCEDSVMNLPTILGPMNATTQTHRNLSRANDGPSLL